MLDFKNDHGGFVRNHKLIALRYLRNEFFMDFITIIPMFMISEDDQATNRHFLWYLPKILRVFKGLKIFNTQQIMKYFSHW